MTIYAIIGGAFLFLGFVLWFVWSRGKSSGAVQHEADSATAGLRVEKKMAQAAADAPADLNSIEDAARRGKF
jgi:hypothetical protein